jgi:tetratricopeptide (TPR) repeat protein
LPTSITIALDPKEANTYFDRGEAYYYASNYDKAIADFNQAITLNPTFVGAYLERGVVYRAKKDYTHAIDDYTQTIQLDPKNAPAYNNRCMARALAGNDLQRALADCSKALKLTPDVTYSLYNRGLVELKLGAFDAAVADYSAAIAEYDKDAESFYGRGVAKLKNGDTVGGNADIAAAKMIRPDIDKVYAGYGVP